MGLQAGHRIAGRTMSPVRKPVLNGLMSSLAVCRNTTGAVEAATCYAMSIRR